MFIRPTVSRYNNKSYTNHLLVESYRTANGPRHKVLCSLGDLSDRSECDWYRLVNKIESALNGQRLLFPAAHDSDSSFVAGIIERIQSASAAESPGNELKNSESSLGIGKESGDVVGVHTDQVRTEDHREGGSVHVGIEYWKRLELPRILAECGFSERLEHLTCAMVMNRLIHPTSELAMPPWIRSTALCDVLDEDFSSLNEDHLYRHLDRLYPLRSRIESQLAEVERSLFNLDHRVFLYDLTSTYFEGKALANAKACRGYSRDKRPDCPQVVIGLVINGDGFPLCHEVFEGNVRDTQTLCKILDLLDKRVGLKAGQTVVVDRGMAYRDNIEELKRRGLNYIVASRQSEREKWLADFDDSGEYEEIIRPPSPRNPFQKKSRVRIKMKRSDGETYILCISSGRIEKDRAIREKQEKKLLEDLNKLKSRINKGKLKKDVKIGEAVGRLRERYPRVARYYTVEYDKGNKDLIVSLDLEKMNKALRLDGAYLLKSSRSDLKADEVWKTYMLLTRVENSFRNMKSPLLERPLFHQLERRVDTHIFLCVLAYHLLVSIEKTLLDKGRHTSWKTVRETLGTHQVATVVLPTTNGAELRIRQDSTPEKTHRELYKLLEVPHKIMAPIKTWREKEKKTV